MTPIMPFPAPLTWVLLHKSPRLKRCCPCTQEDEPRRQPTHIGAQSTLHDGVVRRYSNKSSRHPWARGLLLLLQQQQQQTHQQLPPLAA